MSYTRSCELLAEQTNNYSNTTVPIAHFSAPIRVLDNGSGKDPMYVGGVQEREWAFEVQVLMLTLDTITQMSDEGYTCHF